LEELGKKNLETLCQVAAQYVLVGTSQLLEREDSRERKHALEAIGKS
jgi:hypothetical protein